MVGRSLSPSIQVPTDFRPLKLAQLLFLLTLIQASDHSREKQFHETQLLHILFSDSPQIHTHTTMSF
jgi:hypothetical protein